MNEKSSENINRFLEEVGKYNFWNSIDIKIIAAKLEDKWTSLVTKILLIPENKTSSERLVDLQNFMILHEVLPIENLKNILDNLINRKIKIGIDFEVDISSEIDFKEWDRKGGSHFKQSWPVLVLRAGGRTISELPIYEKINEELRNCDIPYEDLFVVCEERLDIKDWNTSHLHVVAPIYIGLREIILEFKENKILINVECHKSLEPRKFKLSAIVYTEEKPIRKKMEFNKEDIVKENEYCYIYQKQIEIPTVRFARFYLFLNDKEIEERRFIPLIPESLVKINPGVAVHEFFDKDYKTLNKWLDGKGNDPSRDFEASIHWLFHLSGFQSEWLGYAGKALESSNKGLSESDILALVPNNQSIVVAECTTSPAQLQEKIAQVFNRAKEVEKILQNFEIIPAIFIPISKENIPKDIRDSAEKNKIALIEQEEIKRLLEMVFIGTSVDDVFNHIKVLSGKEPSVW